MVKVGQEYSTQRQRNSVLFASCEVVTEPADNNISIISVPAIRASSINRSVRVGALSVEKDCFVKS